MPLDWECLQEDQCHRAKAPLFGSIRVERYSADGFWLINWSVPGFCDTLIPGKWATPEAAKATAQAHVYSTIASEQQHFHRLLGSRDGLSHALISVGAIRNAITGPGNSYLPPKHHNRKRAAVMARLAEVDKVRELIRTKLDGVKAALSELST